MFNGGGPASRLDFVDAELCCSVGRKLNGLYSLIAQTVRANYIISRAGDPFNLLTAETNGFIEILQGCSSRCARRHAVASDLQHAGIFAIAGPVGCSVDVSRP